ncbi:xanthine dehydrogenase family protein subunit M [Pseudoxanthomonas sp. JBR18]|uniref:FAD binding domain-containing protein n=1 Tax=Pseudoxanthomonas sp. JBR18 TaxID=2969308 RepID=UPI0023054585|nr:xanthine dehydrogenase family protein subunit M [Pseudoxanthomonas sp. JBR18]WCE03869.1 xanthine dehydrogenase family protein subunit M [Pseudoxanthomonas sp. JBR18]
MGTRDRAGMNPFTYQRPDTIAQAVTLLLRGGGDAQADQARPIAGGTNLLDLMKLGIMRPRMLADLNGLPMSGISLRKDGGLSLGALARNAATAYHPEVERRYPLLAAAILAGASPQIRNMASNGGNLLQRTRCTYFYDRATPCNKREPGTGCSAIGGLTKYHAILGVSDACIATHPSDMCVALRALDAVVQVVGPEGERSIAFEDFHRLPGETPQFDTHLAPDEVITRIDLPQADALAGHSSYLKIRERLSYAFALVSVAAALDLGPAGEIRDVRVALGGVAHKPWRVREAEQALIGGAPSATAFEGLAEAVLDGARGQGQNDFKLTMARRAVVRALELAHAGTVRNRSTVEEPA